MKELIQIQQELKAPKTRIPPKGAKYHYRNMDDILEPLKILLARHKCILKMEDEILLIGDRYFTKSVATISNGNETESATGFAGVDVNNKFMSFPQSTGASSSYARKIALGGLLLLDDSIDSGAHGNQSQSSAKAKQKKTFDESNENWDAAIKSLESGQYTIEAFKSKYKIPVPALKKLEEAAKKSTNEEV